MALLPVTLLVWIAILPMIRLAVGHEVSGGWNLRRMWRSGLEESSSLDSASRLIFAGACGVVFTAGCVALMFALTDVTRPKTLLWTTPLLLSIQTATWYHALSRRPGRFWW